MNINIFSKKSKNHGILRCVLILSVTLGCILSGFLFMEKFGSNKTLPQPLTEEEIIHYKQCSIFLPDTKERNPIAVNVLAQCTPQEEKIIGDTRYIFYTSDLLPQYIYRCASIREIMETSNGTVYITYMSLDAEQVILTIGSDGIIQRDIYAEKTNIYYVLSELENYKIPNYRH